MSGVSLNRGLERPLSEAGKVEPDLPWRPQNVRVAIVVYLLSKATNKNGTIPRERSVVQSTELNKDEDIKRF